MLCQLLKISSQSLKQKISEMEEQMPPQEVAGFSLLFLSHAIANVMAKTWHCSFTGMQQLADCDHLMEDEWPSAELSHQMTFVSEHKHPLVLLSSTGSTSLDFGLSSATSFFPSPARSIDRLVSTSEAVPVMFPLANQVVWHSDLLLGKVTSTDSDSVQ